jgi:prepilin-type N-terminal cleavage/methylation domain-containing protein/prepilin-type processing-associated H-X9-DG protein
MSSAQKCRTRRGFTLVELLVVIGIIAILISVLLPTLASARRSAASVKCLSNLKNLHNAFLMYAGDYKNAMPVGRQDTPDNPPAAIVNGGNGYWQDAIYPYLLKSAVPTSAFAKKELETYRKSVLWCPVWEADNPQIDLNAAYAERFKTGYGYNIYFGYKPQYPNPDALLPAREQAMRSAIWNAGNPGKYYKRNEITEQANRALVADTNLWILCMGRTNAQGDLLGQSVQPVVEHNVSPGGMNYDRYRHGKYPKVEGTRFATKGGIVAYNVLFVDGHAATLNSVQDGYKAIRMRYP